jgi:hypothetical protein
MSWLGSLLGKSGKLLAGYALGKAAEAGKSAAGGLFDLPRAFHSLEIHVWGDDRITRAQLLAFAQNVLNTRITNAQRLLGWVFGNAELTGVQFLTEKHVAVTASFAGPPIISALALMAGTKNWSHVFGDSDNTGNLLAVGKSPAGPSDDGVGRAASYLADCVAGALTGDAALGQGATVPTAPPVRSNPGPNKF